MRSIMIILCLGIFSERIHAQSTLVTSLDSLQRGDTLYLNFYISPSEFGSTHEGILLFKIDNNYFGKYVIYNYGVTLLPNKSIRTHHVKALHWHADTVVNFYNKFKKNYFILKDEWKLDKKQVDYVNSYFFELERFKIPEGFSNAPDFYTVISRDKSFVVLDLVGAWNKYLEIYKVMGL